MRATEILLEAGAVPIYYFAYGMLTDPKIMQGADFVGTAVLKNFSYEMLQYANVYPESGDQVIGVLWSLDRNMLAELDRTEGYPQLYDRNTVPVYVDGNKVVAELYTMTPETRGHLEGSKPRKSYVARIARGYQAAGVPIEQLVNSLKPKEAVAEKWSQKYKNSINCSHPKGFSQKAHCAGKKKHNESAEAHVMEMVCEDCGMCESHANLTEIKKGAKDSNGYTRCWPGKHAEGTKTGKNSKPVRNCVPNESITEDDEDRGGGGTGRVERGNNTGSDKYTKDPILNYKGLTPKIKDFIRRSYVTNPQSDNDLQATFGHMADMEKIMTDMSAELERIEDRLNDGRRVMQQQDAQIRAIARQSSSPNNAPVRPELPIMARSNSEPGPQQGYRLPARAEQPAQESVQEEVADKFNVVVNDRIVGTYHVKDQAYAKQRELKQQDPHADVIVTPVFSEAKVSANQRSFDFDEPPAVKPKSAGTSIFDMESDDIDSIPTKPTFNKQGKRIKATNNFNKPAMDYMYGKSNVPPPRKIPMYFFKVGQGGRSFTDADLNVMGMRKSAKGAWYFKPTPEMTPQEILARVKELEIKTNVKAREWMPEQMDEVVAIQQNLEESWQTWIKKGLRIRVDGI